MLSATALYQSIYRSGGIGVKPLLASYSRCVAYGGDVIATFAFAPSNNWATTSRSRESPQISLWRGLHWRIKLLPAFPATALRHRSPSRNADIRRALLKATGRSGALLDSPELPAPRPRPPPQQEKDQVKGYSTGHSIPSPTPCPDRSAGCR